MEHRLKVEKRTLTGKQVKNLRNEGKLPGVIYGPGMDASTPITIDEREAGRVLRGISPSSIVTLELDGDEVETLVRETQYQIIRSGIVHVDFLALVKGELVRTAVTVELVGTAPAVKDHFALITQGLSEMEVEAVPKDLPEVITVDISDLNEIGDGIYVRDLTLPEGVTALDDPDAMVAVASAPAAEEIEEEEGVEDELLEGDSEPEVIEKGKSDDEAGEEE